MYQVTVKGRTLEELKDAVNDINNELHSNVKPVNGVVKTLKETEAPTMELAEDEVEVASPYAQQVGAAPVNNPTLESVSAAEMVEVNPLPLGTNELDAEGIPWDKRIHACSKGKVAKGTWRTKRGLDVAVLAQVKAELLQAINLKANPIAIPAAPISAATPAVAMVPEAVAPVALTPAAPVIPVVVAPPVAIPAAVVAPVAPPVAPVVNGGHTLQSFKDNMAMTIGTLITEGKLTQDYVNQLMAHFGVTEIWNVNEAQKEEMFTTFVAHSIIVQVA